jgi:hypothetical protein
VTLCIPYLLPVLKERLNADDIEGLDSLPTEMRPTQEQKALVMVDPPETSEEVRVVIAEIMTLILTSTPWDCMRGYIDILVDICRTLCMDPSGVVIMEGTQAMKALAVSGGEQLKFFCEFMGRALFTSFVHKNSKVRIAGLNALWDVMACGIWKTSVEVLHHMVGFKDPNLVAIKDFYDPGTRVNYLAMFVADRSVAVRNTFYKTLGDMLKRLPDKIDHEGRLFPYMISGLFDNSEIVQTTCFEIIEELGLAYEEEYEEKLREHKQFGVVAEWTLGGSVKDTTIAYPFPFTHRPRLGARWLVR